MATENSYEYGQNQVLADKLTHYLSSNNTTFAFLISGEWGAGKTHFIQQFVEDKNNIFAKEKRTYCYISLYGVNSFDEIDKLILTQTHPVFSKNAKSMGRFAMSLLDFSSFALPINIKPSKAVNSLKDVFKELWGKLPSDFVVIFDDIERSSLGISDVLGYCNKLINENKVKVILISDESKNSADEKYTASKEKIIGISMQVVSDPEAIYNNCVNQIKHNNIKKILSTHRQTIVNTYKRHDFVNLRSLLQFFYDAEELLLHLDEKILAHAESCKEIILHLFFLSYLYKNNKIKTKDIEILDSYIAKHDTDGLPRYEQILKAMGFSSIYTIARNVWGNYFKTGSNFQDFNNVYLQKIGKNIPTPYILWNFWSMNSKDFAEHFEKMNEELKNHKYIHIPEFLHAYSLLIELVERSLICDNQKKLVEEAKTYIDSNVLDFLSELDFTTFAHHGDNYVYHAKESEYFKEILKYAYQKYCETQKQVAQEELNAVMTQIQEQPYKTVEFYEQPNAKQAIFFNLTPQEFVKFIIETEAYFLPSALMNTQFIHNRKHGKERQTWFQEITKLFSLEKINNPFIKMRVEQLYKELEKEFKELTST